MVEYYPSSFIISSLRDLKGLMDSCTPGGMAKYHSPLPHHWLSRNPKSILLHGCQVAKSSQKQVPLFLPHDCSLGTLKDTLHGCKWLDPGKNRAPVFPVPHDCSLGTLRNTLHGCQMALPRSLLAKK